MKRRPSVSDEEMTALAHVMAGIDDVDAMRAFLTDLCTPAELEALTDRWRVVPLLAQEMPYRQIHECTSVSVTTIGRVARHLEYGAGGYAAALATLSASPDTDDSRKPR